MAGRAFIKISVFFAKEEIVVTSTNINDMGDRIILRGEDFALIPHRSAVDVAGYLEDGVVLMSGMVTLSTTSQLNFDILKSDGKQERRNSLKVKVFMNARLIKAYSLGKKKKPYALIEPIRTRDLSLGGVAFYANKTLLKRQRVEIDFDMLKPGFVAQAEILRRERGSFRGGYRYKYGCRFLNVSREEERFLCEFVLRTQIETHRKMLHNMD